MDKATALMREYETIYVLNPAIADTSAKDFMIKMKDVVARQGGKNIKVECLGRRKLAWERGKQNRGLYVLHTYLGQPGIVEEYERTLAIDDNVMLRQSVVRGIDVDPSIRVEEADRFDAPVVRERREHSRRDEFGQYDDSNFDFMSDDAGEEEKEEF
jgi:small subunit ribosomal protein S6